MPGLTTDLILRDGTTLVQRSWSPAGTARGTLVIAHGLGEHSGRYSQLAGELVADGWLVRAVDHRGHGRSPGSRGVIPTSTALQDDIIDALDAARRAQPGLPVILLGHSMGGAFAGSAVLRAPAAADALILSSPALQADLSPMQQVLMRGMQRIAPSFAIGNGLNADFLSHDAAVVSAYRTDPLVHDRVSARLAQAIVTAGAEVRAAASRWRVPTLLVYAGDDRIVNPRGSAEFAAAAPRDVVTAARFDGLWHEIFNEVARSGPVSTVRHWLGAFGR